MNVDGMSYRQWQKRNRETLQQLSKAQQQTARQQGYRNVGWQKIQQSWQILQTLIPADLLEARLNKGDLLGAIGQVTLEAEQAQAIAQEGITNLKRKRNKIQELAEQTLNKYQLL